MIFIQTFVQGLSFTVFIMNIVIYRLLIISVDLRFKSATLFLLIILDLLQLSLMVKSLLSIFVKTVEQIGLVHWRSLSLTLAFTIWLVRILVFYFRHLVKHGYRS